MDGTRPRRTLDLARQAWYSHWRSVRFARHMGFAVHPATQSADRLGRSTTSSRC